MNIKINKYAYIYIYINIYYAYIIIHVSYVNKIYKKLEISKLYVWFVNGCIFFLMFITFVLHPL